MKKAVIYTSLTGGYDNLPQYDILDSFFDYICFTNDYPDGEKVGQWEVRSIPIEINDKTRLSRYVKLMPHKVFPDYEYSIWFDANLEITDKKIYEIIKTHISAQKKWCGIKHPTLDCIYQDAKECLKLAKVTYREIVSQVKFLRDEKFPEHFGLFENNVIIRNHNDNSVRNIDEQWWNLYMRFSRRDQMSLFYIFWKNSFEPNLIFKQKENTHNCSGIRFVAHNQRCIRKKIMRKLKSWFYQILLTFSKSI